MAHLTRKSVVVTLDFSHERNNPRRFLAELKVDEEALFKRLLAKARGNAGVRAGLAGGAVRLTLTPAD